ncbi:hypothetical protein [Streptomyces longispororuber]|uniref:hypothetical protein n=1 Tax=Streptomyces longispororuber TaxID=68230 RepID=UPI00210D00EB|nr:hypothetical protein [Streptomyces longispororuber]MCQ4213480.1 hypothetical protein [Streptomyces longispororuber]
MHRASVGRAVRLGACGTAVAGLFVVGLGAGTAMASDTLWVQSPYELNVPLGVDGGEPPARSLDLGLYHDNSNVKVTDGRLTVDVSGLAGVADIVWPANCAPEGTVAVCTVDGEIPVTNVDAVHLGIRAAAGAQQGAQGTVTYKATATTPSGTMKSPEGFTTTVTVASGPDLALTEPDPVTGAEPGSTTTVPFTVTNEGNETAHGYTLTMSASYGLDFATTYPQCAYRHAGGDEDAPMTHVTCAFDDEIAPGASVQLPEPLRVDVNDKALNERLDLNVAPAGGVSDIDDQDNYVVQSVRAANTADFAVRGADVTAAAGETVTAELRFENKGPAWFGNLGSGDPAAVVEFRVPQGTTVTGAPTDCRPRTLTGGYYPDRAGAPRYDCNLPYWVSENAERAFAFQLRVDSVVEDATGPVVVRPVFGAFDFDPETTNNTAKVVVNAAPAA